MSLKFALLKLYGRQDLDLEGRGEVEWRPDLPGGARTTFSHTGLTGRGRKGGWRGGDCEGGKTALT